MLSELEITQFQVFGFVVLRGFLSQQDVDSLNAEFDVALERAESTMERASFRKQLNWWNFMPDTRFTASLLEQPRFLDKVKQLLGDDVVASFSASNSFSGDRTDWHPDSCAAELARPEIRHLLAVARRDQRGASHDSRLPQGAPALRLPAYPPQGGLPSAGRRWRSSMA